MAKKIGKKDVRKGHGNKKDVRKGHGNKKDVRKAKSVRKGKAKGGRPQGMSAEKYEKEMGKMVTLLKTPQSASAIAKKLKCSLSTVYYRINALGNRVVTTIAPRKAGKRGPRSVLFSVKGKKSKK